MGRWVLALTVTLDFAAASTALAAVERCDTNAESGAGYLAKCLRLPEGQHHLRPPHAFTASGERLSGTALAEHLGRPELVEGRTARLVLSILLAAAGIGLEITGIVWGSHRLEQSGPSCPSGNIYCVTSGHFQRVADAPVDSAPFALPLILGAAGAILWGVALGLDVDGPSWEEVTDAVNQHNRALARGLGEPETTASVPSALAFDPHVTIWAGFGWTATANAASGPSVGLTLWLKPYAGLEVMGVIGISRGWTARVGPTVRLGTTFAFTANQFVAIRADGLNVLPSYGVSVGMTYTQILDLRLLGTVLVAESCYLDDPSGSYRNHCSIAPGFGLDLQVGWSL